MIVRWCFSRPCLSVRPSVCYLPHSLNQSLISFYRCRWSLVRCLEVARVYSTLPSYDGPATTTAIAATHPTWTRLYRAASGPSRDTHRRHLAYTVVDQLYRGCVGIVSIHSHSSSRRWSVHLSRPSSITVDRSLNSMEAVSS